MNKENSINIRFKEAYKHTGLNCNSLAKLLGINQRTMYNYTDGHRDPSYKCVSSLCAKFPEISFEYIMDGKGELLSQVTDESTTVLQDESPVDYSKTPIDSNEDEKVGMAGKMENIYQKLISALEGQIEALKEKCSSQEEQINLLRDLMDERK